MTVIAQNVSVVYVGTGSVGPFAFNFPISSPAAMKVILNQVLLNATDYIIVPVNNNYDNGGSVTLVSPAPAGQTLILQRSTPLTQASVFKDNLPQPMQQWENALDKLTEIVQEIVANMSSSGSGSQSTIVTAGPGIVVTGNGRPSTPYVVSLASTTPLAITSFVSGDVMNVELGFNMINPAFVASYTGTPTSANLTNTDSVDSPHVLVSPFTAVTLLGTFVHNAVTTVTWTLHASDGINSPTASVSATWLPRVFGGRGGGGATSSVTASGTTAILSNGVILDSSGLGAETVGQTFGPYAPDGEYVYLLLIGGSHTFTDALTGFPFAFDAPIAVTFVNQYGVTQGMYLYKSTNLLAGNFEPRIAS